MLGPVGGEFGDGLRGEDEGWGGEGGEVTMEGCCVLSLDCQLALRKADVGVGVD